MKDWIKKEAMKQNPRIEKEARVWLASLWLYKQAASYSHSVISFWANKRACSAFSSVIKEV